MNFAANVFEQLPPWYLYGIAFVYGAFVGSFLNVCIIRVPLEDMSVFSPARSICFGCNKQIAWYDNIPILSYLWLRGRCRCEKYSISLQYPLVELMTAVMAVAVVRRFGPRWESIVIFAFICALIVITFIDLAYWIIPDVISLPTIPLAMGAAALFGPPHMPTWQDSVYGALLGGGSLLAIHLFYEWVLKRTGLGLGDVKLLAMIGAFVGWRSTLTVVFLASIQGVIVTIFLYLLGWREQVPKDWEEDQEQPSPDTPEHEGATKTEPTEKEGQQPTEAEQPTEAASAKSDDAEEAQASLEKQETPNASEATEQEASKAPKTSKKKISKAPEEVKEASTKDEETSPKTPDASKATEDKKESEVGDPTDETSTTSTNEPQEPEEDVTFGRVAIPFGPFLALGALEVIFWGERIVTWWMETIRRLAQP